jgi:hypothetical protein
MLKAVREKNQTKYESKPIKIKITADFSTKNLKNKEDMD